MNNSQWNRRADRRADDRTEREVWRDMHRDLANVERTLAGLVVVQLLLFAVLIWERVT